MSELEKTQLEVIEDIISRKMKPLYWIHGGTALTILGLFLTISLPISERVINLSTDIEKKIDSDEVYRNCLTKGAFLILQKYEHEADLEAMRNPENADLIYMKLNSAHAESLELISRNSQKLK